VPGLSVDVSGSAISLANRTESAFHPRRSFVHGRRVRGSANAARLCPQVNKSTGESCFYPHHPENHSDNACHSPRRFVAPRSAVPIPRNGCHFRRTYGRGECRCRAAPNQPPRGTHRSTTVLMARATVLAQATSKSSSKLDIILWKALLTRLSS